MNNRLNKIASQYLGTLMTLIPIVIGVICYDKISEIR